MRVNFPMSNSVSLSSNLWSIELLSATIFAVLSARSIGLEYIAEISIGLRYFPIFSACSIPILVKGTPSVRPASIRFVLFSA